MKTRAWPCAVFAVMVPFAVLAGEGKKLQAVPVPLREGGGSIGFDDLMFAPASRKILAPGGQTGALYLVDPQTRAVSSVTGLDGGTTYLGGHWRGATSADEGQGFLFIIDRTAGIVAAIDPSTRKIAASAPLSGGPDYVRSVASLGEVWVTEPDKDRIEVFSFWGGKAPSLARAGVVEVAGGPESLVIDVRRGRAYTHLWDGATVSIDLKTHAVRETWPNGCGGSRGIALDEARGFLFAGCAEGKATVLDVDHGGKIVGELASGKGVDVIAYSPKLGHLYVPGGSSATLDVLGVAKDGSLSPLAQADTAGGSHCAASDDRGQVWVCDPGHGQLLLLQDPFPGESR